MKPQDFMERNPSAPRNDQGLCQVGRGLGADPGWAGEGVPGPHLRLSLRVRGPERSALGRGCHGKEGLTQARPTPLQVEGLIPHSFPEPSLGSGTHGKGTRVPGVCGRGASCPALGMAAPLTWNQGLLLYRGPCSLPPRLPRETQPPQNRLVKSVSAFLPTLARV